MSRDLNSYFNLLNLELHKECIKHGLESSRTGEATSVKRMQSGSSSRSGCNRGAAVEADAIAEQQPKCTQSGRC